MAATIIAAVGLAIALGSSIYGAAQKKKAEKLRAANVRPTYTINPEELENQRLTEARSRQGLPESVKQYYRQGAERGLSSTVDAILKGGGTSSDAGKMYGQYNDSMARLAVSDDARNYQNIQSLIEQNRRMSGERDKEWQVNKYGPYADKAQLASEMAQSGQQYINSGINIGSQAVAGYAQNAQQKKDTNDAGGGAGDGLGGGTGSTARLTGNSYSPSLMNSSTGQQYLSGNSNYSNFKNLTPQQAADINGLTGYRYMAPPQQQQTNYFDPYRFQYT